MKTMKAVLHVNEKPIELNEFAGHFLENIVLSAAASLKGPEDIKTLEFHYKGGNLTLTVNGAPIPLSAFPEKVITGTLLGLISSYKGVEKIEHFTVAMKQGKGSVPACKGSCK
ncbi:MAG: hypothetical protein RDV48_25160 [Candidatus Eremiobacteraeota bacterium]|nr:hypothetical protein [Candidatus Eremiobacteraeota bacterium]